jgi:hypothetical protein
MQKNFLIHFVVWLAFFATGFAGGFKVSQQINDDRAEMEHLQNLANILLDEQQTANLAE